eukprot:91524-Amphidinium_carterae.1
MSRVGQPNASQYPMVLCRRLARAFAEHCRARGVEVSDLPDQASSHLERAKVGIALHKQPGGRRAPVLVLEHKYVDSCLAFSGKAKELVRAWSGRLSPSVALWPWTGCPSQQVRILESGP